MVKPELSGDPAKQPHTWTAEWKEECLVRFRLARQIKRVRSLQVRRDMIADAERKHGKQFAELLKEEIRRQWQGRD